MDVRRAVELVNTMPILRLNIDIVELVIADPYPNNISVIINFFFFLFNDLYLFLYCSLSIISDVDIF